jgi:hypothetical protein
MRILAVFVLMCFYVTFGIILQENAIIIQPAFWSLYGSFYGILSMAILVTGKS